MVVFEEVEPVVEGLIKRCAMRTEFRWKCLAVLGSMPPTES